jgi:hypothetical protein
LNTSVLAGKGLIDGGLVEVDFSDCAFYPTYTPIYSLGWGIANLADASVGFPMELILARNDGYVKAMPMAEGLLRTLDLCLLLIPASLGVYYSVDSLRENIHRKTTDRSGQQ